MSTTLVYWLTFLGTCRLFSDMYAFNLLFVKLMKEIRNSLFFMKWYFLPWLGGPFWLYVQDQVNCAQGFAVNYQQLVKKKTSAPMFLYLLMTFVKIFSRRPIRK